MEKESKESPTTLLCLPQEILLQIFQDDELVIPSVTICRALLPFAELNRYRKVGLLSQQVVILFCWTMRRRPDLVEIVELLSLTSEEEFDWETDSEVENLDAGKVPQSDGTPDHHSIGPPQRLDILLIPKLLRALPNLKRLSIVGREYFFFNTAPPAYFANSLRRLRILNISPRKKNIDDEDDDEDDDDEHDQKALDLSSAENLFETVRLLPKLVRLSINGFIELPTFLPPQHSNSIITDNETSDDPVERRVVSMAAEASPIALPIRNFEFRYACHIGEEFGPLFQALPKLAALQIQAHHLEYPLLFPKHLAFLSSALTSISLEFGNATSNDHPPSDMLPKLDAIPSLFPGLTHLLLGGPIYTEVLFNSLPLLKDLRCLHFLRSAPIFGTPLIDFITSPSSDHLHQLDVHVCHTDHTGMTHSTEWRDPHWEATFDETLAEKLVYESRLKGISVGGTILCALDECGGGSACARLPLWDE